MKIVLITHHFPPNYYAGAEMYALRVSRGLKQLGHTVEVIAIESISDGSLDITCRADIYDGVPIHRLYYDLRQAPNAFEWSFRNPQLGEWVRQFLERSCPDVVHVSGGYLVGGSVIEAAQQAGIPVVLTLHDYWWMCPRFTLMRTNGDICDHPVPPSQCVWCSLSEKRRFRLLGNKPSAVLGSIFVNLSSSERMASTMGAAEQIRLVKERRAYLNEVMSKVNLVISPSKFLLDKVNEYGLEPQQQIHAPFGLDTAAFSELERTPSPGRLRIGYLGQISPHKGVHILIEAFRKLNRRPGQASLVIYGKFDQRSAYGRKLAALAEGDTDICLAGPFQNARVGQVLSELDVVVVPSVWYENRPTVIIEAQAAGTPVIASNLGGMAELVQPGQNGLLFEMGSSTSLASQLQRLLDETGLLDQLRRGIQPVPNLHDELEQLISIYQSTADKSA